MAFICIWTKTVEKLDISVKPSKIAQLLFEIELDGKSLKMETLVPSQHSPKNARSTVLTNST